MLNDVFCEIDSLNKSPLARAVSFGMRLIIFITIPNVSAKTWAETRFYDTKMYEGRYVLILIYLEEFRFATAQEKRELCDACERK